MDVCLVWVLRIVRYRFLRRADHSSRGVLPTMVRRCVWSRNLVNEEAMAHWGGGKNKETNISYVYWTVHHLDSWVKRDQLDVTCFITSLFNAQHVSDVNISILKSLRLICWVISWVLLLWLDVCWCYVVVWLWCCGFRMQAEAVCWCYVVVWLWLCGIRMQA